MKEKINLLSKGIFEYGCPDIRVSEEQIDLKVESGRSFSGEFSVYSTNEVSVRAKVFSSCRQMKCEETDIIGRDNRIHFKFSAENMEPGEKSEGYISIVSNGGVIQIPFRAVVCSPYCMTDEGEVGNLEEFTILALERWHEAVDLFKSEDFSRVFLINKIYAHVYEKLMKAKNPHQAMEEFLYTLKKKEPISISADQKEIFYKDVSENVSGKITLEKSTWGYQEIFISVEGDFLSVYKKRLTTLDFSDSCYELEYFINPEFLKRGKNHGKIILNTFSQKITIEVACHQEIVREEKGPEADVKSSVFKICHLYLDYKAGRIDKEKWCRETREAVDCCRNNSDDILYTLMEAHFLMLTDEVEKGKEIVSPMNARELRKDSLLLYCYHLYLTTFYRTEPDYVHYVITRLWEFYEGPCDCWQVLWMLLQIDERLMLNATLSFKCIKAEFYKGCRSPLMYEEALRLANDDPSLVREVEDFEVQLFSWGKRNKLLDSMLVGQYADLAIRGKNYHPVLLKTLIALYNEKNSKLLLSAVCSTLIKGNKVDPEYNHWYLEGINHTLSLTRLYEYYMQSLDEEKVDKLPIPILLYFRYNNQLNWQRKAFLYAYIIRNRSEIERIFISYNNIIKAFVYDQLSQGHMNENLACLYKFYLAPDKMNIKLAKELPDVLFKHQIMSDQPGIVNVIVTMREINKEFSYPMTEGKAFVDIFMDEYNIAFEDAEGNRYMRSVEYEINKLLDEEEFVQACLEMHPDNGKILMNRSEKALKYQMVDDNSVEVFKRTLRISSIRDEYRRNILKNLIDIFYENYEGETLEKYMVRLDIHLLGEEERANIIDYYIQRGFYNRAFDAIGIYGYEGIENKRLMRLTSRMIRKEAYKEEALLLEMAFYVFREGTYDEVILDYLNRYYIGTTEDYMDIWQAAGAFEVKVHQIEEKILCQVLFTEDKVEESGVIFDSYYCYRPNIKIVQAYLAYSAYGYLARHMDVKESIFHYMEIEMDQMGRGRDICSLAMLKHFSENRERGEAYNVWICREVRRFLSRGVLVPWFKSFMYQTDIPKELIDRACVAYTTKPGHTVKVRFRIDQGEMTGKWQEENMQNVYGGIFSKSWTLFADEKLICQALDHDGEDITVSECQEILPEVNGEAELVSGRDYIDRMILQKDFNDYDAFYRTAKTYNDRKLLAEKVLDIL